MLRRWNGTRGFREGRVSLFPPLQDMLMKRFALLSLLCLTIAAALAPAVPAFADEHKDNMTRRCKNGGC